MILCVKMSEMEKTEDRFGCWRLKAQAILLKLKKPTGNFALILCCDRNLLNLL